MRITKNQLRRSIKEEIAAALREDDKKDEGPGVKGPSEALPTASAGEQIGKEGRAELQDMEDIVSAIPEKKPGPGAKLHKRKKGKTDTNESRLRITKNQLKQIIKEELAGVVKEGWRDYDLNLGGGMTGKMQREYPEELGEYDPYTAGELTSDIQSGASKVASLLTPDLGGAGKELANKLGFGGGEDFEAMDDDALKDRLITAQAGMINPQGVSTKRSNMNDAAVINNILKSRAGAAVVDETRRRRKR